MLWEGAVDYALRAMPERNATSPSARCIVAALFWVFPACSQVRSPTVQDEPADVEVDASLDEPADAEVDAALATDSGPSLPLEPATFRIELSGTSCLGDCPTYRVAIDQDGNVEFDGRRCVARHGKYSHRIAPSEARAIYDALSATEFGRLRESYASQQDGCELITDGPSSDWLVTVDGEEKRVRHYKGCLGFPELKPLQEAETVVQTRGDVSRYLEPRARCLGGGGLPETTLRVSKDGVALAILEFRSRDMFAGSYVKRAREFELRDCAGAVIATDRISSEGARGVLLRANSEPIPLPMVGDVASIVIELLTESDYQEPLVPMKARALRQESDIALDLAVGASCN